MGARNAKTVSVSPDKKKLITPSKGLNWLLCSDWRALTSSLTAVARVMCGSARPSASATGVRPQFRNDLRGRVSAVGPSFTVSGEHR